ncbi:hypothetical protein VOLCADRAFT_103706 [Volvox carteri f. nagariensis]|uniref:ABM domain-containing protein n=1 Tax=Volvox carteri f. nagariensis TaxID=3068 RepID=D8TNX9_VOLCA|nr:uncharacterized protein VOLCADRAFT_103706 [Volvox carteri f. nagariensis]EFJ50920.1 hypothetical protein VOLCADRAFT_103706 [Volvox carteri f. nagariensis]|eukprot:XP_002947932.1 hypothetical protein VOLCADRAFT_103706 [Volvox carteri f. nagariensis]
MAVLGTGRCSLPSRQRLSVVAAHKARSLKQVAVSRTLIAKKDHEAQVASIAGEILKWSEQECEVAGKGIVAFDCVRDGWEANTFHFWERYVNTEAFGAHTTAPRMIELLEKLQPHLEKPIGMSLYSYEDGRIGPVAIQAGPKGEGGLDDATGASGAAGGASYKQTSRAFDLTKVDEHAEAHREQLLLSSMDQQPAADQQPTGKAAGETAPRPRSPLPSLQDILGFAAAVKDSVLGPLCKLLRH